MIKIHKYIGYKNTYDYIVNYYKDSFDNNNKITSETRKALNGTVINESNVERDKYLPKDMNLIQLILQALL